MPHEEGADRSCDVADAVGGEGQQRARRRVRLREEDLPEDQGGRRAVDEEVVVLEDAADPACECRLPRRLPATRPDPCSPPDVLTSRPSLNVRTSELDNRSAATTNATSGASAAGRGEVRHDEVAEHPPVPVAPAGSTRSLPKSVCHVCRLASRNTQYELMIMWTSMASTSRVKLPSAQPRRRISSISRVAGDPATSRSGSAARCSARWMFSIATSRMKSGWLS